MGPRIRNGTLWLRRFAGTTPGVVAVVVVVSVVLCLLAGFASASQLSGKSERRDVALERTEPLAFAAQRLYVALSAADASAATAFLAPGVEGPALRKQYQQSLADAAAALSEATAGVSDEETRQIVARIAADLPAYTGLVETARANNRQGFPVGSSYLRAASEVMQKSLLPNAERLTASRFAAVHEDQKAIAALPGVSIVLIALVLLTCVVGSWILLQRTNRMANLGVLAAAGAAALALLWAVVATSVAADAMDTGAQDRFETLAKARISAQQARTEETLQLITRGDIAAGEENYNKYATELRDRIGAVVGPESVAAQELTKWTAGHRAQIAAYQAANYPAALEQAIGTGPASSATQFAALDRSLNDNLTQARRDLRDGLRTAGTALILSPLGTLALLVLAAAAVVAGVWPRLKEFL
ncbi:hypothetical protein NONI108955_38190 [Nocardia ninae]|uniref:Secreted protein n=1 Tax=Nocardia ninae NBRC 108245 TaxID=1210091 RepID=A0A511M6W9_9NOCA|nr:hypothetical protein [Nocardia ninae]GEM36370.1 hypothetical protein NN4_08890 [Nocardia ninae NBRC 108245]